MLSFPCHAVANKLEDQLFYVSALISFILPQTPKVLPSSKNSQEQGARLQGCASPKQRMYLRVQEADAPPTSAPAVAAIAGFLAHFRRAG